MKPNKSGVIDSEKVEKMKPTATRNLILIRHGQYNLNGSKDEERYLTALGRISFSHEWFILIQSYVVASPQVLNKQVIQDNG